MPRTIYRSVQQPLLDRGALEEPTRARMARIPAQLLEMRRQSAADESIKQFIANQTSDPAFVVSLRAPIKPSLRQSMHFRPHKLPSLKQKVRCIPLHLPETMYRRSGLYPEQELARRRHEKHETFVAANRRRILRRLRRQEPELPMAQEPLTRRALAVPDRLQEPLVVHSKHMFVPQPPSSARPTLLQCRTRQGKPRLGNDAASENAPGTKTLSTAADCGSDANHAGVLVGADATSASIAQADVLETTDSCQTEVPDAINNQTKLDTLFAVGVHADDTVFEVHTVDLANLESNPQLDTEAPTLPAQAAGKCNAQSGQDAQRVASALALHADQLVLRESAAANIDVDNQPLVGELNEEPKVQYGCREHMDADPTTLSATNAEPAEVGKATHAHVQTAADALSQHAAAIYLQAKTPMHYSQPEALTSSNREARRFASVEETHASLEFPDENTEAVQEAGAKTASQDVETVAFALAKHAEGSSFRSFVLDEPGLQTLGAFAQTASQDVESVAFALVQHAEGLSLRAPVVDEPGLQMSEDGAAQTACQDVDAASFALVEHAEGLSLRASVVDEPGLQTWEAGAQTAFQDVEAVAYALVEHAGGLSLTASVVDEPGLQMWEASAQTAFQDVEAVASALVEHAEDLSLTASVVDEPGLQMWEAGAQTASQDVEAVASALVEHAEGLSLRASVVHEPGQQMWEAGAQTTSQDVEAVASALAEHAEGVSRRASGADEPGLQVWEAGARTVSQDIVACAVAEHAEGVSWGASVADEPELQMWEASARTASQDAEAVAFPFAEHAEGFSLSASAVNKPGLQMWEAGAQTVSQDIEAVASALAEHAEGLSCRASVVDVAASALAKHAEVLSLRTSMVDGEEESHKQIEEAIVAQEVDWPPSPGSVAGELLTNDVSSQLVQQIVTFVDGFDCSSPVEAIAH